MAKSLCLTLVFALGTSQALACKCKPVPEPRVALKLADAVFSGKVVKSEEDDMWVRVTLKVDRVWKGSRKKRIVLATRKVPEACGFEFKMKQSYLVYCYTDNDGKLSTSRCTRTKPLGMAKEDLEALGDEPADE